jgi:hypothetical protein
MLSQSKLTSDTLGFSLLANAVHVAQAKPAGSLQHNILLVHI